MVNKVAIMSPKQIRFSNEYLLDFNGTAAAIRSGYSAKSAKQIATENLAKPSIQALIKEQQVNDASKLQMSRQRALEVLLDGVSMAKQMNDPATMIQGMSTVARMLGFTAPAERKIKTGRSHTDFKNSLKLLSEHDLLAMLDQYNISNGAN